MNKTRPRTLAGFMELLPAQQAYFEAMARELGRCFSMYGFMPLDTPLMEASEVLLAKGGGETEKQIYSFRKGDVDLALRYELTASLAKYVALYYDKLAFPFRRYEIGKVYRGERPQRGRLREFYQADIDIIGDGALETINEAELPAVIYKALDSLGLRRFAIHISNRKILAGLLDIVGVGPIATDVMRAIDKLGKIGPDKLRAILTDDLGMSRDKADEIIRFVGQAGDPLETVDGYRGRNAVFDRGADELLAIKRHLAVFGVPDAHYIIDLSIARGLDYYTGTVYETYLTDFPQVGSICSGGRYDDLAECFMDRKMPGVGISIGLSRLFCILQEQGMLNDSLMAAPADVLIIPLDDAIENAVVLASSMREAGLRTQIYGESKKFKMKVAYADKLRVPFVVFLGEDEIKAGTITVKEMSTGAQTTASAAILTAGIAEKVARLRGAAPIADARRDTN